LSGFATNKLKLERREKMKTLRSLMIILMGMFFATCFVLPVGAFNPQPEPPAKPITLPVNTPEKMKLEGIITKIEGSKIILRDEAGKLHTIGVRAESNDDKHKLRGFKLGDKVKIEGGRLMLLQR
jgi:hypothetical protein